MAGGGVSMGQTTAKCSTYFMLPAAMALLIISTSLRGWAISEVHDGETKGDVTIGLWSACADMPCRVGADNDEVNPDQSPKDRCNRPDVFSDIDDCRYGHCVKGGNLNELTSWDANNLCNRSAVASAFAIIAILVVAYTMYITTLRDAGYGCTVALPAHETAAWLSLLAAMFAIISWSVMKAWLKMMNDEKGSSREQETDTLKFDDLKVGWGMSLMCLCWIMLFFNVAFHALAAYAQEHELDGVAKLGRSQPSNASLTEHADEPYRQDAGGDYMQVTRLPSRPVPAAPGGGRIQGRRNSTSSDV